jgi:hypothetical protein
MTMPRLRTALLFSFLFAGAVGCDNVGRAFDPNRDPEDPVGTPGTSTVQVVPVGGDARDGRPKVKAAFPNGGGWPTVVPIVIEFSESVNQASIRPSTPTGTDGRIVLRISGSTQVLPCQYDFVANGRVLVMRPVTALSNAQLSTYEVVLLPDARDVDGVRFLVSGTEQILTDFQVNQAVSFTDGRILTTYPRDNARDVARENDYYLFFDRPCNEASISSTNVRLRRAGADVAATRTFPLTVVGIADPRVLRVRPSDAMPASTRHEVVVDNTITFGQDGVLDFRGRTPFAVFDTIGPAAPTKVELGVFTPGFPNKINQSLVSNVVLHVTTPPDTAAGDRVVARIYGGNAETTTNTADLHFVQRVAVAPVAGTQTLTIGFDALLGTVARPKFDDGSITFAVQTQRGSEHSGFTHNDGDDEARFDITLPTLSRAGPPGTGTGFDVVTDQEYLAYFGTASEEVGEVTLTDGVNPAVGLFASSEDGRFLLRPLALGAQVTPRMYSMTLTDSAGNMATNAVTGQIVRRGLVTGTVGSEMTVEVYDHRTLLPIANATVLVDPMTPTIPADPGRRMGTTGTDGRALIPGLTAGRHTVTVVRAGFHLLTIYDTSATLLSLPLRPITNATATLQGNAVFTQVPGATVLVGCSAFDDQNLLGARTSSSAPTTIPPTAVLPNRPMIVTALGGVLEPSMQPAFSLQGFQSLASDLMTFAPPLAPPAAGAASDHSIPLVPSVGSFGSLSGARDLDFGGTGVDLGDLNGVVNGVPFVRVTASLQGFGGQVLLGVGFSQLDMGTVYKTDANWSGPGFAALANFGATLAAWVVTDARDGSGRISRHRFLLETTTGLAIGGVLPPQAVPAITLPTGSFANSPAVEFTDVLDPAAIPTGGLATLDVSAEDAQGRRWTMIVPDTDAVGGLDTVQFPDLTGVAGLQAGTWTMRVEARLWLSLTGGADNWVLTERRRAEVNYSRSLAVPFSIQ